MYNIFIIFSKAKITYLKLQEKILLSKKKVEKNL